MKQKIKKYIWLLGLIIVALTNTYSSFSQAPQAMKYQAVARDKAGAIISNTDLSVRIKILKGISSDNYIYSEIHNVRTNQFGLIYIEIGNGKNKEGEFSAINWGNNADYFLQVEIGNTDASSYHVLGKSQLLSVPYALYAEKAGNQNYSDTSAVNELQVLSYSGDTLTLSNGNFVLIPSSKDNDNANELQYLSMNGDTLFLSEGNFVILPTYTDNDSTNELQYLSLNNDTLHLSKGNFVVLPGFDSDSSFWKKNENDVYFDEGNVGIGITSPKRVLHISEAIRLEPMSSPPSNPVLGDLFVDKQTRSLLFFNGILWDTISKGNSLEIPTDGLVAYYPFNGNANDESGNGNDGTVNGATLTTDRFGNLNQAFEFDGSTSNISLPDSLIGIHTEISISIWFKTSSQGVLIGYSEVLEPSVPKFFVIPLYIGTYGYLRGKFWDGELWSSSRLPMASNKIVNDDNWHHVVIVAQESTQFLYLDNVLVERLNYDIVSLPQCKFNQIGNGYGGYFWPNTNDTWYHFEGKLDDIRIYHRALNEEEIRIMYYESIH